LASEEIHTNGSAGKEQNLKAVVARGKLLFLIKTANNAAEDEIHR
jgi:hypothetical protein